MSVRRGVLAMSLLGLVGCGAARRRVRSGPRSPNGTISAPARYAPPAAALDRAALRARLPTDHRLTPDELVAQHAVRFTGEVGVEPDDVDGMSAVQGGPFALRGAELEHLRARGFALAPRLRRPNFLSGYVSLYVADQPVYLLSLIHI